MGHPTQTTSCPGMQSSLAQTTLPGTAVSSQCCSLLMPSSMLLPLSTPRDVLIKATALGAGTFKLTLEFSEEYPNKAPLVKFKSKMFHPNSEL